MAEAHQAVAFQFTVTPEGPHFQLSREALQHLYLLGVASWKKRLVRAKNRVLCGLYPISPSSWMVAVAATGGALYCRVDPSAGIIGRIRDGLPCSRLLPPPARWALSAALFSSAAWLSAALLFRAALRLLLSYHGWMFEPRGRSSAATRIWAAVMRALCRRQPLLYSFQSALPCLPVPPLDATIRRYLQSVRPLLEPQRFAAMEEMAEEFRRRHGPKLQRALLLKWCCCANYVSDWWERFVYLRSRGPLMVNSNYYAMDFLYVTPTPLQAARAGNAVHAMLLYRRKLDRGEIPPTMALGVVPMCSAQSERMFNTTRIPGTEEDRLQHVEESRHVAVFHGGRFYKVWLYHRGALLSARDLEMQFQRIIDDPQPPLHGEERLAALTAGERAPWAEVRSRFFSRGPNKASLDAIERSAFFVTLDEESHGYGSGRDDCMDAYAKSLLHGSCYDRWFDKSFTLVVYRNGKLGINAEHSWADAPIIGHLWEFMLATDEFVLGYGDGGHCVGDPDVRLAAPQRLQWDIPDECRAAIDASFRLAKSLADDVDFCCFQFDAFGKGFMKGCAVSPDAFIQIALQLAHFRDRGGFCLTYEASMTRLFRAGRTETVRSCTAESCAFVRSMAEPQCSPSERRRLFRVAAAQHQQLYRMAMTGAGIDRHLFCLYVASRLLGVQSPFLAQVLAEPWRLSTSQTPQQQLKMFDLNRFPNHVSCGGGFGPVADDGYGVSYIIAGENLLSFHISSKRSCGHTDSKRFGAHIRGALMDIAALLGAPQQ